jgi:CRISPR-associated protein Cmr3
MPSTIAGGLRNKAGLDEHGTFDQARSTAVQQVQITGPLLVELDDSGTTIRWFAPAPADALALSSPVPKHVGIVRLLPLESPAGVVTNMPTHEQPLALVGMRQHDPRKPFANPPRFWTWCTMEQWLLNARDGEHAIEALGVSGLAEDARTHVSIDPTTQTAVTGALFQTRGLEFTGSGRPPRRLALAAMASKPNQKRLGFNAFENFRRGLAPLGGERRIAAWRRAGEGAELPKLRDDVRNCIARAGACRLLLLTPAIFRDGFRPSWLFEERDGVKPTLVAAAVPRSQVISGWNLQAGTPKPTRRLAPAGSVYFLKLSGTVAQREAWLTNHWMTCVSDAAQDRCDGFGLAVFGCWDGRLATLMPRNGA